MEVKNEVIKKYRLYLTAKKLIVTLGTLSALCLTLFFLLQKYNLKFVSFLMFTLSMLSLVIFAIFWISIKPMKRHILHLIKEYEQNGL